MPMPSPRVPMEINNALDEENQFPIQKCVEFPSLFADSSGRFRNGEASVDVQLWSPPRNRFRSVTDGNPFFAPISDVENVRPRRKLKPRNNTNCTLFPIPIIKKARVQPVLPVGNKRRNHSESHLLKFHHAPPKENEMKSRIIRPVAVARRHEIRSAASPCSLKVRTASGQSQFPFRCSASSSFKRYELA